MQYSCGAYPRAIQLTAADEASTVVELDDSRRDPARLLESVSRSDTIAQEQNVRLERRGHPNRPDRRCDRTRHYGLATQPIDLP